MRRGIRLRILSKARPEVRRRSRKSVQGTNYWRWNGDAAHLEASFWNNNGMKSSTFWLFYGCKPRGSNFGSIRGILRRSSGKSENGWCFYPTRKGSMVTILSFLIWTITLWSFRLGCFRTFALRLANELMDKKYLLLRYKSLISQILMLWTCPFVVPTSNRWPHFILYHYGYLLQIEEMHSCVLVSVILQSKNATLTPES